MARPVSLAAGNFVYMNPPKNPIVARLQGGDHSGLVIELPDAFRGIDVKRRGKVARYRYGGVAEAGPFYVYRSDRRGLPAGATPIPTGTYDDDVIVAGLGYYP
jgi:hypothetical protein